MEIALPVWQDCKRGQESSRSHNKTQRSWEPVQVGWDVLGQVQQMRYPTSIVENEKNWT